MESVTWTCHCCGQEREDSKIDVYKTDLSLRYNLPPGTVQQNVRYCNDSTTCVAKAPTIRLLNE